MNYVKAAYDKVKANVLLLWNTNKVATIIVAVLGFVVGKVL